MRITYFVRGSGFGSFKYLMDFSNWIFQIVYESPKTLATPRLELSVDMPLTAYTLKMQYITN